jgi:transcriptional regulator with XRE-family HTH domain
MSGLGTFVYERRKELNLRQQDLADALGYTVQAISRFENGACSMDISSLPALAGLLKISLDDLYHERVSPNSVPCSVKFDYDLIGKNLTYLRLSHHLTREEVAAKIQVTPRSLANYERGVSLPSSDTVRAFLDLYQVPADELFGQMLAPVKPSFWASHRKGLLIGIGVMAVVGLIVGATSPLWFQNGGVGSYPSIGRTESSSSSSSSSEGSSSESTSSESSSDSSSSGSSSSSVSDDLEGVSVLGYVNGLTTATLGPGKATLTVATDPASWYSNDKFARVGWRFQETGSTDSSHASLASDPTNFVWTLTIASDCLNGGKVTLQVYLTSLKGSNYDHYSSQYVTVTFSNPA